LKRIADALAARHADHGGRPASTKPITAVAGADRSSRSARLRPLRRRDRPPLLCGRSL